MIVLKVKPDRNEAAMSMKVHGILFIV